MTDLNPWPALPYEEWVPTIGGWDAEKYRYARPAPSDRR